MSARVYVCISHPEVGGAGVCQGHQHHGRQQISVLRRHKFMTQWGVGQIQHQQEVQCIDKLGGAQASAFMERQTPHGNIKGWEEGTRGLAHSQRHRWWVRPAAGAASVTQGSCATQEEPHKRSPLLDDLVQIPIHKWVGVLGLCQECERYSVPRGKPQGDQGLSQGLAVWRLDFRSSTLPPVSWGAVCADVPGGRGAESQHLQAAGRPRPAVR